MLIVVSPAKRLDWAESGIAMTTPDYLGDANSLARTLRGKTLTELQKLMPISADLARLNRDRYRDWQDDPVNTRPAVHAYAGDTYVGLDASSLDADEMRYAQDHLRILSGIYGLLRPLDAVQPHRLEMGTRLKTRRGKTLYDYWRDTQAKALNAQAEATGTEILVNCASKEYFEAVDQSKLSLRVISPVFMEMKPAGPKIVSFFAKKARGAMARFIIRNRLTDPVGLREFDLGGYRYQADISEPDKPVFIAGAEG